MCSPEKALTLNSYGKLITDVLDPTSFNMVIVREVENVDTKSRLDEPIGKLNVAGSEVREDCFLG